MAHWRLLDTGVRTAAENMALDSAVLKARGEGVTPNTLRFLQFSPSAALVGYHQDVAQEVRDDYCRLNGIDVNRRLTGGGAIFFDQTQLGWEIIASKKDFGLDRILFPFFERICRAAIRALGHFGIEARYRFKNDIEVAGRKISGTGGVGDEDAFLFQGTLLMDFDVESMLYALRVPTEKLKAKEISSARDRVTSIKRELGYLPPLDEVKAAMVRGFSEEFGVRFKQGTLHPREQALFKENGGYYNSGEWVYGQGASSGRQLLLRSIHNTPGGLVRAALSYDAGRQLLNSALITGDFFAFPSRTIYDLEAYLKGTDRERIKDRVEKFFETEGCQVPGVSPDDFTIAINKALAKADYKDIGLQHEEANAVFTVHAELNDIHRISTLLIPYCSKPIDCSFRGRKGCDECGGCSVGELYCLAREYGVEPVSVVNFEDLMMTLRRLKSEGAGPYLGSCCEAFFIKHEEDFRAIKMPGILVDIDSTTCYDLSREVEAKQGKFENQTELKTDLIHKLLQLKGTPGRVTSWG